MTTQVLSFETIRYSPFSYQPRPNADEPAFHFCWLKSSVNDVGDPAFTFALPVFVLVLTTTLALRFVLRVLALRLLFFDSRFANAISMTTRPAPITASAATPPSIHQTALDFLRGGGAGVGDHCCGGGG